MKILGAQDQCSVKLVFGCVAGIICQPLAFPGASSLPGSCMKALVLCPVSQVEKTLFFFQ